MTFTYEANAEGYRIFWNGKPLGGVGIIGKYRGRKRKEQVAANTEQAKLAIKGLEECHGPKHMLDALNFYQEEWLKAEQDKAASSVINKILAERGRAS